jgi:hypothetical protein
MPDPAGYVCRSCGEWHDELPFAYHAPAPATWSPELADDEDSELGEEQCVVRRAHFFVRALIRLPVLDAEQDFEWGVWVSLSDENFLRMSDLWEQEGREAEPPMFGWLSTELPIYTTSTLNLKAMVHMEPVGLRPLVELEPTTHPLSVEQRDGIDLARVQEFAARLLHGA